MRMRRRLAAIAATAAAVAATAGLAVGPASADTVINVSFPVNGTTHIRGTGSDVTLGPGTLAVGVDLSVTPNTITGSVSLPPATSKFKEFRFIPVSATIAFVPVGQTTGTVTGSVLDGQVSSTSEFTLQITALSVGRFNVPLGRNCETVRPATLDVTSAPDFNALAGGTLTGTYTIPRFRDCGLFGFETPLINAIISGPGNTISLTLGAPTLG